MSKGRGKDKHKRKTRRDKGTGKKKQEIKEIKIGDFKASKEQNGDINFQYKNKRLKITKADNLKPLQKTKGLIANNIEGIDSKGNIKFRKIQYIGTL